MLLNIYAFFALYSFLIVSIVPHMRTFYAKNVVQVFPAKTHFIPAL